MFRLAREGDGSSGPMGVKSIATHLNAAGIRTPHPRRRALGCRCRPQGADSNDLCRPPPLQYQVLEDPRTQARDRSRRDGRAANYRSRRVLGGSSAAQELKSGDDRAKDCQRPDATRRHLLLRRLWHGDDAAHRQERPLPLLHLLHQSPPGQHRLSGSHRMPDTIRTCDLCLRSEAPPCQWPNGRLAGASRFRRGNCLPALYTPGPMWLHRAERRSTTDAADSLDRVESRVPRL